MSNTATRKRNTARSRSPSEGECKVCDCQSVAAGTSPPSFLSLLYSCLSLIPAASTRLPGSPNPLLSCIRLLFAGWCIAGAAARQLHLDLWGFYNLPSLSFPPSFFLSSSVTNLADGAPWPPVCVGVDVAAAPVCRGRDQLVALLNNPPDPGIDLCISILASFFSSSWLRPCYQSSGREQALPTVFSLSRWWTAL